MVILSQNRTDRSFFVGMTKNEYFKFIKPIKDESNQDMITESNLDKFHEILKGDFGEMIKEVFECNQLFDVYVSVKRNLSSAFIATPNYPFANFWNGYSPWERFTPKEIKDINEIRSIEFINWDNEQ